VTHLCARSKKTDVALAKADLPGPSKAMRYRFFNNDKMEKVATAMTARRHGKLQVNHGYVDEEHVQGKIIESYNHFGLSIALGYELSIKDYFVLNYTSSIPGDSGGIVSSPKGELMGFLVIATNPLVPIPYSHVIGIKLRRALNLVSVYSCEMKKRGE
jgi:hypothetical protein